MFWFGRPPYLRWLGAAVLVLGAGIIEFRPTGEADYPFAATAIEAGDALVVEWRRLPDGLYPRPVLGGTVAAHPLVKGEPITSSDVRSPVEVPDGWWALVLEVPIRLAPGTSARLELAGDAGISVPGIVVASNEPDRLSVAGPTALVAVPGEHAALVAGAAAARQIVVLVEP